MLVLAIGDWHIPNRVPSIHPSFDAILKPGKIQHILCTGNLTNQCIHDYLKCLCADVHVVKGEFDEGTDFPHTKVLQVGSFKIGLTSGHQIVPWGDKEALSMLRRQLNVDILISGHTHQIDAYEYAGGYFINPGSATGASTPLLENPTPSLMLLDILDDLIHLYLYTLVDGKCTVSRADFKRPVSQ